MITIRKQAIRIASIFSIVVTALPIAAPQIAQAAALPASISAVDFQAAVHSTYDHEIGGGKWMDGSVTWQKNELQATDYQCTDYTSYFLKLDTPATPLAGSDFTAKVVLEFTRDTTGQSGVALEPMTGANHLMVQSGTTTGDTAPNPQTPTAKIATSPAPAVTYDGGMFVSGKKAFLTFYVENIKPSQTVIVRSDAQIFCKMNSAPTGNLQANLVSVDITSSSPVESISAGAQTVNFKTLGNLGMIILSKKVTTGTDCATAVKLTNAVAGSTVKYCFTITNYRNSAEMDLSLDDDSATPLTPGDDVLNIAMTGLTDQDSDTNADDLAAASVATASITASYGSAGTYQNEATLKLAGVPQSQSRAVVVVGPANPDFTIDKTSAAPTFEKVGDTVTYTITMTNTGNVALNGAFINDPTASFTSCENSGGGGAIAQSGHTSSTTILDPAQTWTCTATYTVLAADVTAGKIDNTATGDSDETASKTASKTVDLAVFTISKTSTSYFSKADDVLTYTITMTNTGTVQLTSATITDPTASFTSCTNSGGGGAIAQSGHTTTSTTLAVSATWTCTATYTVLAADVTAGKVDNTATGDTDQTGTKDASKTVNISAFTISKTSTSYFSKAGETLTYTITLTNTGGTTLTGVYIVDTIATFTSCTNSFGGGAVGQSGSTSTTTTLKTGNTWTCTATYVTVAGDVTAGKVDNTATGYTTEAGNKTDSKTVNISSLSITKTSASYFSKVGDVVTYTITVTNTGTPTLTGVTIADPKAVLTTCTNSGGGGAVTQSANAHTSSSTTLTSGKTWTCTATYTIVAGDVTAGKVDNTATADSNETDSKTDSKTVDISAFTISKTSTSYFSKAGETLTYTITITNTGSTTLNGVYIVDTKASFTTCTNSGGGGAVSQSGSTSTTTILAVAKTWTCTATYTTVAGDVTAGKVDNTATGYTTEAGNKTDSKTINISSLSITKTSSSIVSKVGDTITYTITVTNTGTPTLTGVTIADPKAVLTTCTNSGGGGAVTQSANAHTSSSTTLTSGNTWTCTATYVLVAGDVTAGKVDNTATADSDQTDSKTDSKTVDLAMFTIVKSTVSTPSASGDVITYTIVLTNTGKPTLNGVTIADPKAVLTTCTNSTNGTPVAQSAGAHTSSTTVLGEGKTWTCTATYTVTQADVDAGKVDNTATGDSTETDSKTSDKTVTIVAAPAFTVVKTNTTTTAPKKAGDTVTYSITVTNTGNVTLLAVTITDANAVLGTCNVANGSNLAPAAAMTCAASHVVTQAEVDAGKTENEAVASATGQSPVTSNKVTIPIPPDPKLGVTLEQLVDKKLIAGDKVKYKVVVTNTGNLVLNNVSPVVTNFIITSCTPTIPATLAPGETITCDGYHIVTEKDALAGIIRAKAVATGVSSLDPAITVPAAAPDVEVPLELPLTGGSTQQPTIWAFMSILLGASLLLIRRRRLI